MQFHFQWKATNSEEIPETETTTVKGKPVTTTLSAPVAIMTDKKSNSTALVITPAFQDKAQPILEQVYAMCSKKKRDTSCSSNAFADMANSGELPSVEWTIEGARNLAEAFGGTEIVESLPAAGATALVFAVLFDQFDPKSGNLPLSSPIKDGKGGNPTTDTPDEGEKECDKDAPKGNKAPICRECGASSNSKTCTKGKWEKCPCIEDAIGISVQLPSGWELNFNSVYIDAADQLLDSQKPVAHCLSGEYGKAISMETDFLKKLAEKFCDDDKSEAVLDSSDIGSSQYSKAKVSFKIKRGKGCQATCQGLNHHDIQLQGNATVKACNAFYAYDITQGTDPKCDEKRDSIIPADTFEEGPVWKRFCEIEHNNQDPHSMVVDVWGNGRTGLKKRHDLQSPGSLANMQARDSGDPGSKWIYLSWKPNSRGLFTRNCSGAFHDIIDSACGKTGKDHKKMATSASVFVGAGTYSYKVENRMFEVSRLQKIRGSLLKKDRIRKDAKKEQYVRHACGLYRDEPFYTPQHHWRHKEPNRISNSDKYQIFWKEHCELESGPQKQFMQNPAGDNSISCKEAFHAAADGKAPVPGRHMTDVLTRAESHGGFVDIGCVRYVIYPASTTLTDEQWKQQNEQVGRGGVLRLEGNQNSTQSLSRNLTGTAGR
ncbi:hypothetical protein N7492_001898 [Penicillium capsulatum]|uniref:Uncharacterized protein n=1 Tax=Penicillium capsulatum TaxID=69766 RepID=A0A9W9LUL8_9EURO|nr:hypothetical protein N7492_001898 [Penicillium capsulatum]